MSKLMRMPEQRRQSGQGLVEYALILILVAIVVVLVLLTMGGQLQNVFSDVVSRWPH